MKRRPKIVVPQKRSRRDLEHEIQILRRIVLAMTRREAAAVLEGIPDSIDAPPVAIITRGEMGPERPGESYSIEPYRDGGAQIRYVRGGA